MKIYTLNSQLTNENLKQKYLKRGLEGFKQKITYYEEIIKEKVNIINIKKLVENSVSTDVYKETKQKWEIAENKINVLSAQKVEKDQGDSYCMKISFKYQNIHNCFFSIN